MPIPAAREPPRCPGHAAFGRQPDAKGPFAGVVVLPAHSMTLSVLHILALKARERLSRIDAAVSQFAPKTSILGQVTIIEHCGK